MFIKCIVCSWGNEFSITIYTIITYLNSYVYAIITFYIHYFRSKLTCMKKVEH